MAKKDSRSNKGEIMEREVNPVEGNPPDIEIKPNESKDQKPQPQKVKAIAVRKGRSDLAPADHNELLAFIDRLLEAGAVPKHLKNRLQVLAAWNFAAQHNLPPQSSLRNIAVIEGVPSFFGDLPLALAQRHKDYLWHREYLIDKEYKEICLANKNLTAEIFSGVVEIQRKGMKKHETFTFTVADAERAGLLRRAKDGMPWKSYPQVMFIRRARAMAIKTHFSDALCGAGIAEYDFHQAPDIASMPEVGPGVPEKSTLDSAIDELE